MKSGTRDEAEGQLHQAKGKIKEIAGKASMNSDLEAAGDNENLDGKLIPVIVSGYDGDGSAALCGIKEVGDITIAQKLDTAKQPDMP